MKEVLLDTNFILSCIRDNIDCFEELTFMGFRILVPKEVVKELKKIAESKKSLKFRNDAELALRIIKKEVPKLVSVGGKYVDSGIVNYLKENPEIVLATMDIALKRKLDNRRGVIRGKKKLEIQ